MKKTIRRGDIFYYNFGSHTYSIQNNKRPCLVIQCDKKNYNSPTVLVAAITSVIKKEYLDSHIPLPLDTGLDRQSMVMLEQIQTIDKHDVCQYVGRLKSSHTWKKIEEGLKCILGITTAKDRPASEICCLCTNCLENYKRIPNIIVKRLDPFSKKKESCTKCNGKGYYYVLYARPKKQ